MKASKPWQLIELFGLLFCIGSLHSQVLLSPSSDTVLIMLRNPGNEYGYRYKIDEELIADSIGEIDNLVLIEVIDYARSVFLDMRSIFILYTSSKPPPRYIKPGDVFMESHEWWSQKFHKTHWRYLREKEGVREDSLLDAEVKNNAKRIQLEVGKILVHRKGK